MIKKFTILAVFLLLGFVLPSSLIAQCSGTTASLTLTPNPSTSAFQNSTNANRGPGISYTFSATAGRIYSFRTTGGSNWSSPFLTITNGATNLAWNSGNGPYYNDNCSPGETAASLDWVAPSSGNYQLRVMRNPCAGWFSGNASAILQYREVTPPSNVFGNNTWRVYAFNGTDRNLTSGQAAFGYYEDNNVNINTASRWTNTPSEATTVGAGVGWTGAPEVPIDNHTIVLKRQGFPCGTYEIDVNNHDDDARLYIDGILIWDQPGCCADRGVIWTGTLSATSQVEFRFQEVCGGSVLNADFNRIDSWTASAAASPTVLCQGSSIGLTSSVSGTLPWVNCSTSCGIPAHPASSATNTIDTDIGNFTFLNIVFNSGAGSLYTDNTALTANVVPGRTYPISVTTIDDGGTAYNHGIAIFADWNRDGDFSDAGETIFTSNSQGLPRTVNTTLTVPGGASGGTTRLRVVATEGNNNPPSTGTYTFGATEDYSLNILVPSAVTYGWTGPNSYSNSTQNPTLTGAVPAASGVYTVTATAGSCTQQGNTAAVTVRPTPTASISGTTTVCQGGAAPNVTFTNPMTLPVTVSYNINGGGTLTVNVPASSSATVSAPTGTDGLFTYNLVSVAYQSAPNCSNSLTGSATITVNPVPTTFSANILTSTPLCYGSNARIEVPVSQSGISYQLRDNTSNVGGAQTGTGGSLTFTSNNLTATNGNYNVLATTGLGCTTVVNVASIGVDAIPAALGVNGDVRTCYLNGNNTFVEFRSASGSLIAINPGTENLGNVTVTEYVGSPLSSQACGTTQPWYVTSVLGRHWVITPENQPTGPVTVRLYYDNSEYAALAAIANANANPNDDVVAQGSLDLSKYSNPGNPSAVNGVFTDNCAAGGTTTAHVPTGTGSMNALSGYGSFPASGLYNSYSISSFSEFWLSGTNNVSPLPIVLQSFTASCDKGMVKLDWVTATEINNEQFTIHRSADLMEWEEVLSQAGAGNSNTPLAYAGVDERPLNGLSYYRLTQRDYDGTTESFEPISVTCYTDGEGNSMLVFPNPADDRFTVSVTVTEAISNAGIEIMDMNGKRVMLRNVNLVKGTNEFTFDRSMMNPGTYFIKLGSEKLAISPIKLIIR